MVIDTLISYVPEESALNFDHQLKPVIGINVALEPAGLEMNVQDALFIVLVSPKFQALK